MKIERLKSPLLKTWMVEDLWEAEDTGLSIVCDKSFLRQAMFLLNESCIFLDVESNFSGHLAQYPARRRLGEAFIRGIIAVRLPWVRYIAVFRNYPVKASSKC